MQRTPLKKKGIAQDELIRFILVLIVLLILLIIWYRFGREQVRTQNSCSLRGGICSAKALDAPLVPGTFSDCTKTGEKCYLKSSGGDGTGVSVGGEDTIDGINLFFQTYLDWPRGPNLITFTALDDPIEYGVDVINSQTTPLSVTLVPGRLYGFSAFIKNKPYPLCSIYIIDTTIQDTTGDRNFIECSPGVKCPYLKRVPCDNPDTLPTLYFIPPSYYANTNGIYKLKILGKEDKDDLRSDFKLEVPLVIGPNPEDPKVTRFPASDVHELMGGGYLNKEVSFRIENEHGSLEFEKVRLTNVQTLDFDAFLTMEENSFIFNSRGFGIPPNQYAKITMKKTPWKTPPLPILTAVKDPVTYADFMRERKTCASDTCTEVSFRNDGTVSFKAKLGESTSNFKVYPGACEILNDQSDCISSSTQAETLNCHWKSNKCTSCLTQVKKCSDYKDEYSCYFNSCNLENDPNVCTWVKKRFIFDAFRHDGCESCAKITSCADYNTRDACIADACAAGSVDPETRGCAWSAEKKKCEPTAG